MKTLKTLLVGINAKYIHSNPAIRYIQKYARANGREFFIAEFTINQLPEQIIAEIFKYKPDVLGFSCYIWNIGVVERLVCDIKKILPDTVVVLGGPEITDESFGADYIIKGAGEERFLWLVNELEEGRVVLPLKIHERFDFTHTSFPYDDEDFKQLSGRIIYYEAQRGCPYKCAYCLSSRGEGTEFLPLERVFRELSFFLERKVKQVKFVDRTFNCDRLFARAIWSYIIENDNGITNFHFEIVAELLESEDFALLKKARVSLFQFEIGVQTTNEKTLAEIERKADFARLSQNVKSLSNLGTLQLHLDLIAGLPFESFIAFRKSFNDVFALRPDILQLGFLKVLKGSKIRANVQEYGIKYSRYAPYEVLSTNDISYGELLTLRNAEHMLETYYNSGLARQSLKYLIGFFETPFDFFYCLGTYWDRKGFSRVQHSKAALFEILLEFAQLAANGCHVSVVKEVLVYDMLLNDNFKTFPERLCKPVTENQRAYISKFYSDSEALRKISPAFLGVGAKQLRKSSNVFFFDYAVDSQFEKKETVIFFHYPVGKGKGLAYVLT